MFSESKDLSSCDEFASYLHWPDISTMPAAALKEKQRLPGARLALLLPKAGVVKNIARAAFYASFPFKSSASQLKYKSPIWP
jgi:hypothetical protein